MPAWTCPPSRRRLVFLCLIASALAAPAAAAATAPRTGWLRVNAKPMAQVFVNDKAIGLTPVLRYRLRPGRYTVELRIGDGRSHFRTVQLQAGKTVTLVHRFGPAKRGGRGTLVVNATPWAQVFLDGRAVGNTPLRYALGGRSYNLQLKTTDGRTYKRIIFIEAGKTLRIAHHFPKPNAKAVQGPAGWLRINSSPPSTVFLDGKSIGKTPIIDHDAKVGLHRVKLVTADKRVHQRQVHVARDKTTQLVYRFPPKRVADAGPSAGMIRVAANVQATVYVDGKQVGWTPLIDHALRPGRHRISLRYRKQRRTYWLYVRAGYTRTVTVRFRK